MTKYIRALSYLVAAATLLGVGVWVGQGTVGGSRASGARKILYYVDPMNPAHTTPGPGFAPCGMKMEPVYAEDPARATVVATSQVRPAGTVSISSKQQELLGIRVGTVQAKPEQHSLRLLGKVAVQENRLYRVVANVNGMIMTTSSYAPGSQVKKEHPLATMYSPEFTGPIQSLLSSLASRDRTEALAKQGVPTGDSVNYYGNNLQLNIDNLKFLGFGENQVKEIVQTRALAQNTEIVAPADAIVVNWNISPGLRFDKGTELVRLEDLSKVWILADIFANEANYIQSELPVRVTLSSPKKTFMAKVSELIPQFDGASRTLKVRLEVDNPELLLKPDMFVELELSASLGEGIAVPTDAVLDSGQRQTVYVNLGNGSFEPRVVTTGRHLGDQVEILGGLEPGEQIALSGNFLLDSESRIKLAAIGNGMKVAARSVGGAPRKDPVCGMAVEADPTGGLQSVYQGKTYYFCADTCKQKFTRNPSTYLAQLVQVTQVSAHSD
ncbi:MAG: efflux RND transporter periplasmic adaptor subunit [Verrucomicrobia bacterium]|nr:efflux RND transporter periplasmic adaptor subunit [Verrucomicrobiota bacterium]